MNQKTVEQSSDISGRSFSYAEFRRATALSKKEADHWVQTGVIQAGAADGHRRQYRFESIFEGIIAKQLADFSSRELLPQTMAALRKFFKDERINVAKLPVSPRGPRQLVQIYTQRSAEIMPGGGVRGVISYVRRYEPGSGESGKAVFLTVDLGQAALTAMEAIRSLPPG